MKPVIRGNREYEERNKIRECKCGTQTFCLSVDCPNCNEKMRLVGDKEPTVERK